MSGPRFSKQQIMTHPCSELIIMKTTAAILGLAWLLSASAVAQAETYYYDFGTEDSEVWPGFERVTPTNAFSATQRFGWQNTAGLSAFDCPHTEPANHSTGSPVELSPIWTNPITEDAIVGDRDNVFFIRAEPGEYQVYVVCGSSKLFSNQFFDFTVRVGRPRGARANRRRLSIPLLAIQGDGRQRAAGHRVSAAQQVVRQRNHGVARRRFGQGGEDDHCAV